MIAAIFDCMIFLQAAHNRKGAAGACLTVAEEGHVQLFLSPTMLAEVENVLHRPAIRAAFPRLTDEHIEAFLTSVRALAHQVEDAPTVYSLSRDPKDEPYLNLAIARQPAHVVTWDKDMLPLQGDEDFRTRFPGVTVLNPPAFLAVVRAAITEELGSE